MHVHLTRSLIVVCFLLACVPAWASSNTVDSSPPFALISPAVADRLKAEAATPEAQHLLKEADAGLAKAPNALPKVHTEGTLPHQGIWDQSLAAEKDWPLMLTFGVAYRLTGDKRYLTATERFLSAWLSVYKVSFNPIDETNLDQMILAYDLTRSGLSQPTEDMMATFLRTMAEGYLDKIAHEKVLNFLEINAKIETVPAATAK